MKTRNRKTDSAVRRILEVLATQYAPHHPKARIDAYRYNSVSIRVRIVDPDFEGLDLVERDELVWPLLRPLPEDIRADVSMLLLLTPKESKRSIANMEFEDPTPSRL